TNDFTVPVVLFTFYAPNVFTPERPDNNLFRVYTTNEMEHFHITVYDRRGQMVYKSDDLHFEWDGNRLDGEKCPQGAYVYVITYRRPMTEDIVTQKGTVTLIR
ncbi:MAG: gliding motility-associated C-terminal domain-containing protein, partial [Bacteroidales bacterium]|nr:gliding motility-associated C-terminal domain-containing protein [Bacteroidales bacterium]